MVAKVTRRLHSILDIFPSKVEGKKGKETKRFGVGTNYLSLIALLVCFAVGIHHFYL